MDISVQDITSVDKEIIIKANREDLSSKFDKAFKKYQGQIQMPGFRPGPPWEREKTIWQRN